MVWGGSRNPPPISDRTTMIIRGSDQRQRDLLDDQDFGRDYFPDLKVVGSFDVLANFERLRLSTLANVNV
jgi:hypothetical protein